MMQDFFANNTKLSFESMMDLFGEETGLKTALMYGQIYFGEYSDANKYGLVTGSCVCMVSCRRNPGNP